MNYGFGMILALASLIPALAGPVGPASLSGDRFFSDSSEEIVGRLRLGELAK